MKKEFIMVLDEDYKQKVLGYWLYRSQEASNERPIVDGLYIQHDEMSSPPPIKLKLIIEDIKHTT